MPADRPETCPPTQRFAVFRNPENPPDSWRSWTAYTRDFNTAWSGFAGFYEGHGATRRERKADAIKRAREAYAESTRHATPTPPATAPAPADDAGCVCGEPATKGVVHRTDGPCFHRPGPRWDADPLTPEDHAKCAAEHHPAPADVGDDDPACTCAPLGKATCVKHAPTPDAGAAERAVVDAARRVARCAPVDWDCSRSPGHPGLDALLDAVDTLRAALRGTKGA